MSTTVKILLALIAGAALLCIAAAFAGFLLFRSTGRVVQEVVSGEPQSAERVAAGIADYTLPAGFDDSYALDAAGFSMVAYTGDDDHSHIYLFQLPAGIQVHPDELERQFRNSTGDYQVGRVEYQVVDNQPGTVCGQQVDLITGEGTSSDGETYRQVSAIFQGRGGQAMVMYEAPVDTWDQDVVDDFLASLE